MSEGIHVATIHVPEAVELSRETESASAYHSVRVEPGAYKVFVKESRYGGTFLSVTFTGICTHSGYGKRRYHEEEGKPSEVSRHPYKHVLLSERYPLGPGLYGRVEIHDAAALESARYG